MKLQKMEGGIHGIDLAVTAHAEKEDSETLIEPDIGGSLDRQELVGGLEHDFYVSIQLGMSSSQLTNLYFSEGLKPPTSYVFPVFVDGNGIELCFYDFYDLSLSVID